jgi:hypothetical protein
MSSQHSRLGDILLPTVPKNRFQRIEMCQYKLKNQIFMMLLDGVGSERASRHHVGGGEPKSVVKSSA